MELSDKLYGSVTLSLGKNPLHRRLNGPQKQSEHLGEEINVLPLPQF